MRGMEGSVRGCGGIVKVEWKVQGYENIILMGTGKVLG